MDGARSSGIAAGTRPGNEPVPSWWHAWAGLYEGKLLADDIEQLARDCRGPAIVGRGAPKAAVRPKTESYDAAATGIAHRIDRLLGNHDDDAPLSDALRAGARSRAHAK